MSLRDLTLTDFEETVTRDGITIVDFWADWCGPCKQFAPVFEAAAAANPDITFGKVDTEAEQELAGQAGISSIPTLMLFRDGILLFNQAGALPPKALEGIIQQARDIDMDEVRRQVSAAQESAAAGEVTLDDFAAAHAGGAFVLDVREGQEFSEGHVPGAVHVPMSEIGARVAEIPTEQPVYVVCAVGGRSRQVADFLREQGVAALNVTDGTQGWAGRGWPLER